MLYTNLHERVHNIRVLLDHSQQEFSAKLGITQGALSHIETGISNLSYDVIEKLVYHFNVNPDYLVTGTQPIFKPTIGKAMASPPNQKIPLILANAHADYTEHIDDKEFLDAFKYYDIPRYKGDNYRMFEVEGDSMEPTLLNTDIVIVELIENLDSVGDGKIYVAVSKKGVVIKRIYLYEDGYNALIFKSDNSRYQSYKMSRDEILEIWEVKAKITSQFLEKNDKQAGRFSELEERVENLEKKLKNLG